MNATPTEEVAGYAAAVRAALADLPADVREELLEDLEDHLREVADEEGSLPDRLGPPHVYAAELRASAGLPAAGAAGATSFRPSTVSRLRDRGRRLHREVDALPWGHAVLQFLPELRPAWWVLRGYVAVQALAAVLPASHPQFPVPEVLGAEVVGLMAILAAAAFSVAIARRDLDDRRQSMLRVANVALAILAIGMVISLGGASVHGEYAAGYDGPEPRPAPGLVRADGGYVMNIYPFDANGRPLRDVFLYDQEGRPVELGEWTGQDGQTYSEPRRGLDGRDVRNVFPLREYRLEYGPDGEVKVPVPSGHPNVAVPKLAPQSPLPQPASPTPTPPTTIPPAPGVSPTAPTTTAPARPTPTRPATPPTRTTPR